MDSVVTQLVVQFLWMVAPVIGMVKLVAVAMGLYFKWLAIQEVDDLRIHAADARMQNGISVFGDCCEKIQAVEKTAVWVWTFAVLALIQLCFLHIYTAAVQDG